MAGIVNSVYTPDPTQQAANKAAVVAGQAKAASDAQAKTAKWTAQAAAGTDPGAQDKLDAQDPTKVASYAQAYQNMSAVQRAQFTQSNPRVTDQLMQNGTISLQEYNDLRAGNGDASSAVWTSASGQRDGQYNAPGGPSMASAVVAGAQPNTQPSATSPPQGDTTNPTQGPVSTATPPTNQTAQPPGTATSTANPAPGATPPGGVGDTTNTTGAPVAGRPGQVVTDTGPAPGGPVGPSGPGIVNSAAPTGPSTTTPMPAPPKDTTINATQGTVGTQSTVQGQLNSLLKTGNPLLDAARARAMQTANSRGLQNSSMAAQGGEEAVLSQALPIAGADAATYAQQAQTNQNAANQFALSKLSTQEDLDKAYAAFTQSNFINDKDNALKQYISDSSLSMQDKIAAMQDATANKSIQERLTEAGMNINANAAAAALTWTHQTATNLLNLQTVDFQNYTQAVNIITSSSLEPDQKATAMNNVNKMYAGEAMPDGFDTTLLTTPVTAADYTPPPATTTGQ